jgi:spermidine/putrescine-binding protein
MKKYLFIGLAAIIAVGGVAAIATRDTRPVLKVANWAEYIDGGDEDSELIKEFESWYEEYQQETERGLKGDL